MENSIDSMAWNCSSYRLCLIMYSFVWKINSIDKHTSYKWSFTCYYYYDTSSTRKGLTLAAATATVVFAIQKFIGTPIASRAALQEANRLLVEYHEAKSKGIDLANVDTDKKEAENTGTKVKQAFCEKYDKYYSTNVCIFL